MVAFKHNGETTHEQVLQFANQWIRDNAITRYRIAIHLGNFSSLIIDGKQFPELIGKGINEASRLLIGDGGDIILSEEFFQNWLQKCGSSIKTRVIPQEGPLEKYVKHNYRQRFRILVRPRTTPTIPKSFIILDKVKEYLKSDLINLNISYSEKIARSTAGVISKGVLDSRVSLFAPEKCDGEWLLLCTSFRYDSGDHTKIEGLTRYRAGQGPVGLAYQNYAPVVVHQLPDPTDMGEYCRQLAEVTNLDSATVHGFGRRARSFVALPIGLVEGQGHAPDGVVCLDSPHPLDLTTTEQLGEIANRLLAEFSRVIAAFWNLRKF